MILDRDAKFNNEVITFLKSTGLKPKRTSVESPWQNGIAERGVGSYRRELPDHVIALNEQHLGRLIREYVNHHHEDRTHDSLKRDTPNTRLVEQRHSAQADIMAMPRLGGLHHRQGGAPRHSIGSHLNSLRLAWDRLRLTHTLRVIAISSNGGDP